VEEVGPASHGQAGRPGGVGDKAPVAAAGGRA
jgi:hypothetical protein